MKMLKKGFTLAEVLLAATIAAIIATIGFTVAQKGIANSYNLYVYSGYDAISLAVNDAANGNNYKIKDCTSLSHNSCNFTNHIYELLSGRNPSSSSGSFEFNAPNGIKYKIYKYGYIQSANDDIEDRYEYRIAMTVPSVKTKTSSTKRICMTYQPEAYKEFLIPFGYESSDSNCNTSNMITDIASRKDLLAFYFDDGWRGKVIEGTYKPRYFRSAEEIFCQLYDAIEASSGADSSTFIYGPTECSSVTNKVKWEDFEKDPDTNSIIVRVTDPRRI